MNVNVNLIVENITQIERGITINADVSVNNGENIRGVKQIMFGILVYTLVNMVNI